MASVVAVLLASVLLMISKANASWTATISLSVTTGISFTCSTYPTAVSMGSVAASSSASNMTTDSWTNQFTCVDLKSVWATNLTAGSNNLVWTPTWTISSGAVSWVPAGTITQTNGDCSSHSLGGGWTLDGLPKIIITKSSNRICSFTYVPDGFSVNVPAYTPVASYSGTLTMTDPT